MLLFQIKAAAFTISQLCNLPSAAWLHLNSNVPLSIKYCVGTFDEFVFQRERNGEESTPYVTRHEVVGVHILKVQLQIEKC
jgi:hypothetical protein